MKLLIRNLDRTTTQDELHTLFEGYGIVQSCTIVMDPATQSSKGFGFIEMPKVGDAKAATINLNGHTLGANKIRVKKADDKIESTEKPNE